MKSTPLRAAQDGVSKFEALRFVHAPARSSRERVLTGSARIAQEAQERVAAALRVEDHRRKLRQVAGRHKSIEAQIAALQAEAEAETEEVRFAMTQETLQEKAVQQNHDAMSQQRGGARAGNGRKNGSE